ncbi:MAG: L,D-transpeptidase family protein [Pseudomonadota bacterium]
MSAHFVARPDSTFAFADRTLRCALGKGGVVAADDKAEGDGASPVGVWAMKRVYYRPDRGPAPETGLETVPISQHDGWCDAPDHPLYNRPVTRPFEASHERLWRDDHVYDLVVELGHNDDPVVPGRGSAIFMHVAKPDYAPTEGCVALAENDLRAVLAAAMPGAVLEIAA